MKYDNNSIKKRIEIQNKLKKVLYIVLIIFIYNLIVISISSLNNNQDLEIFGQKYYIISTNSMFPAINKYDVVVCKNVKQNELKVGDVITYQINDEVITHRISRIEEQDQTYYYTKGDNNTEEDKKKITFNDIKGKEIYVIPKFGKVIKIISNKITLLCIILVILIVFLIQISRDEKLDNRREKVKVAEREKKL